MRPLITRIRFHSCCVGGWSRRQRCLGMVSVCSEPRQPKAIPNTSLLAGPYEKVWKDFGRRTNKNKPIIFVDEEARETAAINAHDAALSRLAEAAEVAREEVALLTKAHAAAASNGRFLSGNASDLAIASSLADQLQHQQQQQRPMSAPAQPSRAATRSKIEPPRARRGHRRLRARLWPSRRVRRPHAPTFDLGTSRPRRRLRLRAARYRRQPGCNLPS